MRLLIPVFVLAGCLGATVEDSGPDPASGGDLSETLVCTATSNWYADGQYQNFTLIPLQPFPQDLRERWNQDYPPERNLGSWRNIELVAMNPLIGYVVVKADPLNASAPLSEAPFCFSGSLDAMMNDERVSRALHESANGPLDAGLCERHFPRIDQIAGVYLMLLESHHDLPELGDEFLGGTVVSEPWGSGYFIVHAPEWDIFESRAVEHGFVVCELDRRAYLD